MKNLLTKLKIAAQRLLAFLPSPVPQGVTEFEVWAKSIIDIYGFPDNDSVRFALATMILHSGPSAAYAPKHRFAIMVKAGAAKQVASFVFQEIKTKQKQAEATAQAAAPANVQSVQN